MSRTARLIDIVKLVYTAHMVQTRRTSINNHALVG
jgi:hypothetical protein